MRWMLDRCFLAVRDQATDQSPILPDGWTVRPEAGGFFVLRRNSDNVRILAWRANTDAAGTRGLYAVWGPIAVLNAIAAVEPLCMPARELWDAAQGGNATAIAVARRWPVWRWSGSERDPVSGSLVAVSNVVRRLIFEGQTMPTSGTAFPWRFSETGTIVGTDAEAKYRVSGPISSLRPALHMTIGGFLLHTTLEDEQPR